MSITTVDSRGSIPIAKDITNKKIVYFADNDELLAPLPTHNVNAHTYKCPNCGKVITAKHNYIYHVQKSCPNKKPTTTKCISESGSLVPIPQETHNVIFVAGPPGSGKSYYVNRYARMFKKLFNRRLILFTRNADDPSMDNTPSGKPSEAYEKYIIDDELPVMDLEELRNSLVIFDDIETAMFPKQTKYLFNLLNDTIKNGRHYNISVIFTNQQLRMYKRTKCIFEDMTELVIFPRTTSKYHATQVMTGYMSISKSSVNYIFDMPTTQYMWVSIRRVAPQFVITPFMAYLIGYENC